MKTELKNILAKQGINPILTTINKSVRDLKNAQYTSKEIKETIKELFFGIDSKIDNYINNL